MLTYNAAIQFPPGRDTMGTAGNQRKWREMALGSPGAREYLLMCVTAQPVSPANSFVLPF